jgi:hypothetical protein
MREGVNLRWCFPAGNNDAGAFVFSEVATHDQNIIEAKFAWLRATPAEN